MQTIAAPQMGEVWQKGASSLGNIWKILLFTLEYRQPWKILHGKEMCQCEFFFSNMNLKKITIDAVWSLDWKTARVEKQEGCWDIREHHCGGLDGTVIGETEASRWIWDLGGKFARNWWGKGDMTTRLWVTESSWVHATIWLDFHRLYLSLYLSLDVECPQNVHVSKACVQGGTIGRCCGGGAW